MKIPAIIPTAEPFYFPGGSIGCLLVHGFTGTPKEMRGLGSYLHHKGHTVLGVRLASHATQPQDMLRARWWDWFASVEDGWHLLSASTERVVIMGLSMGGILSLFFAAHFPVSGVVAMATPHHLPNDPRIPFIKPLSIINPFSPKGAPNWYDQAAYQQHVSYPQDPTRAYAEIKDLMEEMREALPSITVPALLIYSKHDQTVRAEDTHAEQIAEALGSNDKRILWIENSGHVITSDAKRETVYVAVSEFIKRIS